MDHLRKIATTYFLASSEENQKKVLGFIKAMDKDGNGTVDYVEFKQYLRKEGYSDYADSDFFKKLDINDDERLDVQEVMTLYYIILSGRPFCRGCENFITAEYFVCVECFDKSSSPVYLCPVCFKTDNYRHCHDINKIPLFLDTYAMLESRRLSALTKKGHQVEESQATDRVKFTPSSSTASSIVTYTPSSSAASSIVTYTPSSSKAKLAAAGFKTFEVALGLANLKVGLLTLGITACTIM